MIIMLNGVIEEQQLRYPCQRVINHVYLVKCIKISVQSLNPPYVSPGLPTRLTNTQYPTSQPLLKTENSQNIFINKQTIILCDLQAAHSSTEGMDYNILIPIAGTYLKLKCIQKYMHIAYASSQFFQYLNLEKLVCFMAMTTSQSSIKC